MAISLQDLTWETFEAVCDLEVSEDQEEFIYPNVYSIAESRFVPTMKVQGIYLDEEPVGFAMHGRDPEDNELWIWRFMISVANQRKGYGSQALAQIIQTARASAAHGTLYTSFTKANLAAKAVCESQGFLITTEEVDEEDVWAFRW